MTSGGSFQLYNSMLLLFTIKELLSFFPQLFPGDSHYGNRSCICHLMGKMRVGRGRHEAMGAKSRSVQLREKNEN